MASQLEGVADLTRALNAMGTAVAAKELRGTARTAAKIALAKSQATIPVGTKFHKTYKGLRVFPGFSKRSLRMITTITRDGRVQAIIGPRREAFYATQFVELGTARMAARPWLRPAFESSQDPMLREIGLQLRRRLERKRK